MWHLCSLSTFCFTVISCSKLLSGSCMFAIWILGLLWTRNTCWVRWWRQRLCFLLCDHLLLFSRVNLEMNSGSQSTFWNEVPLPFEDDVFESSSVIRVNALSLHLPQLFCIFSSELRCMHVFEVAHTDKMSELWLLPVPATRSFCCMTNRPYASVWLLSYPLALLFPP